MKISAYKTLTTLMILGGTVLNSVLQPTAALAEISPSQARRLLIQMGLNPTECVTNVVAVLFGENSREICAFPNANYSAGTYRLNPQTYQLHPVGVTSPTTNPGGVSPVINPPPVVNAIPPNPTMVYMPNPIQPIPSYIQARLESVRSTHQLAPASCGSYPNLVTITVNNTYRMCAYPNANYQRSYSVDIPNLGTIGDPYYQTPPYQTIQY